MCLFLYNVCALLFSHIVAKGVDNSGFSLCHDELSTHKSWPAASSTNLIGLSLTLRKWAEGTSKPPPPLKDLWSSGTKISLLAFPERRQKISMLLFPSFDVLFSISMLAV